MQQVMDGFRKKIRRKANCVLKIMSYCSARDWCHIIRIQLLAAVVPQFACRADAGDGQTFRPKEKEKELA